MKGNPKRPPWSQPLCPTCYVIRVQESCKVTSPWQKPEFCFDCGAVTSDGIYLDIRPEAERAEVGPAGPRPGYSKKDKEVATWVKQHGEYRLGAAPGSAEEGFDAAPRPTRGETK